MIVDPDFLDHWRTRMLVDALGGDEMAPMYVMRIWGHCQQRHGDRFAMPAAGLKALCKASGDAQALETALIDAGFVVREGAEICVPKWAEKNASLLAAWENGNKGGRPKKQTQTKPMGSESETQQEPSGNPSETQTKPIRVEKRREEEIHTSAQPTVPCPYDSIVALYHEHLPTLPKVKLMSKSRQQSLRKLWGWVLSSKKSDNTRRATTAEEALAWLRGYFQRASENDFLMGRTHKGAGHENWTADLDFLLTEKGMRHVIEKTREAA